MNTIILLYLASYAMAWILVEATIFHEPRHYLLEKETNSFFIIKAQQLFSCIYCMSFWTGILCFSLYVPSNMLFFYALSTITITFFIERLLYVKEE